MPFNQLKEYDEFLELMHLSNGDRRESLLGVFNRDIRENDNFKFRNKQIYPTPEDGSDKMDILFNHLTTKIIDHGTRSRGYDRDRCIRLHWIKKHIEEDVADLLIFSTKEKSNRFRTYIYNDVKKYVIVLEPLRKSNEYYFLTAYYLKGKDAKRNKIQRMYTRRENSVL